MNSLISVVIPSYNHEAYIEGAVTSVLDQSHTNLELIVIDDGSKDRSIDYLSRIRDKRFKLVTQSNQGAHAAINRGLSLAAGEYLAVLNSDDLFERERLAAILDEMRATDSKFASSWLTLIDDKGRSLGVKEGWQNMLPSWANSIETIDSPKAAYFMRLFQSNHIATTSNMVFSRAVFERIGGMRNLRFAHDWDYAFRASAEFNSLLVEQPLVRYRTHAANTIKTNAAWMMFEVCWVLAVHTLRHEREVFYLDSEPEKMDIECVKSLLNFAGHDRTFWLIKQFIAIMSARGVEQPEELLLENGELRTTFFS